MTDDHKKRFFSVCKVNGISKKGQEIWLSRLINSPEHICENILALFEIFPTEIGWFSEMQNKKESAMAKNDKDAWQILLKEEESHLSALINK